MLPLLSALGAATAAAPRKPNVVWIVIDTARADYLGPYGAGPKATPAIDALARRGTVYESAWAQGSETVISVTSYFSSRHRMHTGIDYTRSTRDQALSTLAPALTTVAEALAGGGYQTAGFVANSILTDKGAMKLGVDQGFSTWTVVEDEQMGAEGIRYLEGHKTTPFLLYLHYMGPHFPNHPQAGLKERQGEVDTSLAEDKEPIYFKLKTGQVVATPEQAQGLRATYADAMWTVDQQIGEVLAALRRLGLEENTLVVLHADHGEALGDRTNFKGFPEWGHGHDLTPELIHVPLVVAGPGLAKGARVNDRMAELVDVGPSIVRGVGLSIDQSWGWEGAPLWGAGATARHVAIADRGERGRFTSQIRDERIGVEWSQKNGQFTFLTYGAGVERTRSNKPTPAHQALQTRLQDYVKDAATARPTTAANPAMDAATAEQLRALGYLEGEEK